MNNYIVKYVLIIILIFIIITFIYYNYLIENIFDYKILTAIVTIDRDVDIADKLYLSLIQNGSKDILIVTRDSDYKTIQFWNNKAIIITVPHYEIKDIHNLDKLSKKRNIVMDYAKKFKYNALWFVDSDIIPINGTLNELKKTTKDICICTYRLRWSNCGLVGIKTNEYPFVKIHKISIFDKLFARQPCIIGGFGCTFIKNTAFNQTIESKTLQNENIKVLGDDIGFFINCNNAGLECEYLTRWVQPHLYDR